MYEEISKIVYENIGLSMNKEHQNESEITERLKEKLENIWDNAEFIRGVSDTLKTDENRLKTEKLLDMGLTDSSKIVLLS